MPDIVWVETRVLYRMNQSLVEWSSIIRKLRLEGFEHVYEKDAGKGCRYCIMAKEHLHEDT